MKYDVIVYGPIFCDLIFTDLPAMPNLGTETYAGDLTLAVGGSAIVAAGLHRLGVQVGLVAELGSDPFSQMTAQLLQDLGLDSSLIRRHPYPLAQVTVALSFPQDRAFITCFQRPKTPPDLAAVLQAHPASHLHICSFLAALEMPQTIEVARAAGCTISMDPGWDEKALLEPRLAEMISELDLFLPSKSELCHIAQTDDLDQAARHVFATMHRGSLVVKDGPNGAIAYSHRQPERVQVAALPVIPLDTTGAGDAFDAGFLYAYLQGLPLKTCMQYGAVCGGLAITAPGGATAVPTLKEIEQWLSKLPL